MQISYKEGVNINQTQFFPPTVDEYVDKNNPVRAIGAYVDTLNMFELGFTNTCKKGRDGQPAYDPKLLLKIYIYGYINKIRSGRALEKEIKRNIEMIWLCETLTPSYKTINNFRKDNSDGLKEAFRDFTLLCKSLGLISGKLVAVDGAFLQANASRNTLILKKTLVEDIERLDNKISDYLADMDTAEKTKKQDETLSDLDDDVLQQLKERKEKLSEDLAFLEEENLTQYNKTDPDAKLMIKPAHNLVGINTQIAVDSDYKLIVATDVSSEGHDHGKLHDMAVKAREITGNENMSVVADGGYASANEVVKCVDDNITPYTPIQKNNSSYFSQEIFLYDNEKDCFTCPNNKTLNPPLNGSANPEKTFYRCKKKICQACPKKNQCISPKASFRTLSLSIHAKTLDDHKARMESCEGKAIIKRRSALVEHPFGTIKVTLGWTHYLVRGLEKIAGENALIMLSYNFRRLLNILGVSRLKKYIQAVKEGDSALIQKIIAEIAQIKADLEAIQLFLSFIFIKTRVIRLNFNGILVEF